MSNTNVSFSEWGGDWGKKESREGSLWMGTAVTAPPHRCRAWDEVWGPCLALSLFIWHYYSPGNKFWHVKISDNSDIKFNQWRLLCFPPSFLSPPFFLPNPGSEIRADGILHNGTAAAGHAGAALQELTQTEKWSSAGGSPTPCLRITAERVADGPSGCRCLRRRSPVTL